MLAAAEDRVAVEKVVVGADDTREVEAAVLVGAEVGGGTAGFGVVIGAAVEEGSVAVVDDEEIGVEVEGGAVDDGKSVEIADELLMADVGGTDVGPATGTGSAATTEISNGGLYSKVLVKSSIIFRPYFSLAGKLPLPWTVAGMVHVKVPVFSTEAFKLRVSVSSAHSCFFFFFSPSNFFHLPPIRIKESQKQKIK